MPKSGVKLLPRPDPNVHLSKQGYSTSKKASNRHSALKKSSKKYGTLQVLKRVNLIRNLTPPEMPAHKVMSSDINFMKKLYAKEKSRKISRQQSKKKSKKGSKRGSRK